MDNQIPEKTKKRAFTVTWMKKSSQFLKEIKVIPQYCITRIPTAHNFTRDKRAHLKIAAFSLRLDFAKEVNRHFLENEYVDLSFFFCYLKLSNKFPYVK